MAAAMAILAALTAAGAQSSKPPVEKAPVPAAAAVGEAQRTVARIYKAGIDKAKTPDEQVGLAKQLLQAAIDSPEDPAVRFVLLTMARDQAAGAGDADVALRAIDALAESYRIDALAMKADAIGKVARAITQPTEHPGQVREVLAVADDLITQAIVDDQYDVAQRLAQRALSLAGSSKDAGLQQRATARAREVTMIQHAYAEAKNAQAKLQADPSDPAMNLTAGRFHCFMKGEWEKGLPLLARGADAALKTAAEKDLGAPTDPAQQVAVGDAWWDLIAKEPAAGGGKRQMQARAGEWYRKADPKLSGISKAKVDQRLAEIDAAERSTTSATIDLIPMIHLPDNIVGDKIAGAKLWRLRGGCLVSEGGVVEIPYAPPAEYDLVIVIERLRGAGTFDVRLVTGKTAVEINIGGGITMVDTGENPRPYKAGDFLPQDKAVKITYQVRHGGVRVLADDVVVFQWLGDLGRLKCLAFDWPGRGTFCLCVVRGESPTAFRISRCELVPVSGGRGASVK
ncbi:MAG: hypothetical protein K8S99_06765 [Planctomycetes bacterium]|nr:hypothetical protein [Planctomycetota bacterium]